MTASLKPLICLVEDDEIMGESLCERFALEGFSIDWFRSAEDAFNGLLAKPYRAAISDIRLPKMSGEDLFTSLQEHRPALPPFIFITGFGSIDTAVRLLKLGAMDYVTKPFDLDELVEKVRLLCYSGGRSVPEAPHALGVSQVMEELAEMLPRLVRHGHTVLITGESGVGKEYIAQALHRLGAADSNAPFVAVNCGAFPEGLIEAELFGHEAGAFTGAVRSKRGVFEQAHGGTLFLDEIGDMPLAMQVKLLRAVQNRQIVRIGGEKPVAIDFRLILATHRDLKKLVEQGLFREDLFYRINVIHLRIPPLRERHEDILWFARQFVQEYVRQHPNEPRSLHPLTEQVLLAYPWPGNVRELKHCIERACVMSHKTLLMPEACFDDSVNPRKAAAAIEGNLGQYLQACEKRYIMQALREQNWQLARTAEVLGISRKNLWEKMRKLNISEPA